MAAQRATEEECEMRALSTIPTRTQRALCPPRGRGRRAAPHRVAVDLSPQAVERISVRLAQLLQQRAPQGEPELLSAGELARRLRVERPWVYRHRELLGGLRIGAGPKAPWRFDYRTAVEAMRRQQATQRKSGGL
jgi:hypothetical protein